MTTTLFEPHRPLLFSLAYRMLGSVADAEDVVQEAYLRWHRASPEDAERLTRSFVDACARGDLDDLLALLAADAVLWTDGGGKVLAARNLVRGRDHIARFFVGIAGKWGEARVEHRRVNGQPGLVVTPADGLPRVITLAIDGGVVSGVFLVANPDKLRGMGVG
ncbi:MAG TPA: sigma factor [Gemmatimonadales bacterium]